MKVLKTILLTVIMVMTCHTVQAQVADLTEYATTRVSVRDFDANFIGSDGNCVVYVEHFTQRRKQKTELVSYTLDRQEIVRLPLTEGTDTRCYGGFINGQYVDLLMADWKGDDMTLYRDRRDLKSLQTVGERMVLVDYKGTSGDNLGFRLSSSPNQNLLALMYYVGRETQPTEVQVGLYSRELEEYWKVDTRVRNINQFFVNDEGEVAIGGTTSEGLKVSILDGETEKEYLIAKDEIPGNKVEMAIARVANGKIYLFGTMRAEGKDYVALANGTQVNKVFSLCYDTKSKRCSKSYYQITDQDRARLLGLKDDYKWKKNDWKSVQFFSLNQTMPDRDGYYAMMDQMWNLYVDGRLDSKYRIGQMVARVGNDGEIKWVRVFRMNQTVLAGSLMPMLSYRWVSTGRGPMLVWAETKKSAEYAEEKPVVEYIVFKSSAVLTAAIIDREGNMVRQHWPLPGKTGLQGRPVLMENGDWLMLLRGKSKGHLAVMKLK